MHVLITGASGLLARTLTAALREAHHLRLTAVQPASVDPPHEFVPADLLNADDCWRLVRGIDAVIHTGDAGHLPPEGLERDHLLLDHATRGTHHLFQAAVDAGVRRLLLASTLAVFASYPDDAVINEGRKPLPAPAMDQMAPYLAELTAREFARDHLVGVTCLRLGRLVQAEAVSGQPPAPDWLEVRDAAQAFRLALERDRSREACWTRRYAVLHVVSDLPGSRYHSGGARRLGYQPQHRFEA